LTAIQGALWSVIDLAVQNSPVVMLAAIFASLLSLILSVIALIRIRLLRRNLDALIRSHKRLISAEERRRLKELTTARNHGSEKFYQLELKPDDAKSARA
jgi:hypothetical protein